MLESFSEESSRANGARPRRADLTRFSFESSECFLLSLARKFPGFPSPKDRVGESLLPIAGERACLSYERLGYSVGPIVKRSKLAC